MEIASWTAEDLTFMCQAFAEVRQNMLSQALSALAACCKMHHRRTYAGKKRTCAG